MSPRRRWLRLPEETSGARVTLVCIPHAGAGASSFARWPALLGPRLRVARVQLPGREDVAREPLLHRVAEAVAGLGPDLVRLAHGGPVALYGHSTGALVAYELARALATVGLPPMHLAVSGRRAPHLPARHVPLHRLPDAEFLAGLDAMAATPQRPDPLPRTAGHTRYALRVTRADLAMGEEYTHRADPLLDVPLSAFGGDADPVVAPDEIAAWEQVTTGPFRARLLPGGHFFPRSAGDALAALLTAALLDGDTTDDSASEEVRADAARTA